MPGTKGPNSLTIRHVGQDWSLDQTELSNNGNQGGALSPVAAYLHNESGGGTEWSEAWSMIQWPAWSIPAKASVTGLPANDPD